ncbi:glycosyltransferase family 9 protein [Candidatus Fermentibacterales bacterium]|nr:glycosyltransferase family 9 protein [Candidatus Fermentibacterales bacterium]
MSRALVRVPNWLGDLVMSLPALRAAEGHPGSKTRFWGTGVAGELLPLFFPQTPVVDARERPGSAEHDLVVLLTGSFRSALEAFRTRIPRRIGYRGELRSPLLTEALPVRKRGSVHHWQEYRELISHAGLIDAGANPDHATFPSCIVEPSGSEHIAVFPGATYGRAKLWPAERFAEAAAKLSARTGLEPVFYGSRSERELLERAAAGCHGSRVVHGASLSEVCGRLARARLALGNDAGGIHLASALGVPCVAVFGSTDPRWTAPLGEKSAVVSSPAPCSPCFGRNCRIAPRERIPPCLDSVGVGSVLEAFTGLGI